jgi:thiamine kinase-like enzyme
MPDIQSTLARIPIFTGHSLAGMIVEPLASLTNRTCKISLDGDQYVLRIAGPGTERYIDRQAEQHNALLAAGLGIAPAVLFFDPQDGTMLTRFIAGGVPLDAARMRQPAILREAAATLRRLHASGLRFAGRMELFPKLDEYLVRISHTG